MGRRIFLRARLAVGETSAKHDPLYRSSQRTTARIDQADIAFAWHPTRCDVLRRLGNRDDVFRIKAFQYQMDCKFSEIAQLIGKQLGYNLGDERANDEADAAITYWSEHLESANLKVQPRTPLQRLLQEYHVILDRFIAGC
jgi:hypothetical protein